jgi:hypothetical protein
MSELSPKARALLDAARRNHGPSEDDRDRVLAGLHASLGVAGALPTLLDASTATASTSGPQPVVPHAPSVPPPPPPLVPDVLVQPAASKALGWSKLLAWKAGKVYLATLVIGGSAVGVSMMPRGEDDASTRRSAAMVAPREAREPEPAAQDNGGVQSAAAPSAQAHGEAPSVAPSVSASANSNAVDAERATVGEPHARAARSSAIKSEARAIKSEARATKSEARVSTRLARTHARQESRRRVREERALLAQNNVPGPSEPKPSAPAEDVAAAVGVGSPPSPELALIRAALTSLRDHDSAQALRLLDEHAARYPSGAFGTERQALHVVALCAAGRHEEGSRERAQFLKTAGDSPIAARVRSACPR